jgi:hypothetical protein
MASRMLFIIWSLARRSMPRQGKTEDNRIGGKGKYRAVQIVCNYHVVYQYGVNTDTYHNEEALKTKCKQPL